MNSRTDLTWIETPTSTLFIHCISVLDGFSDEFGFATSPNWDGEGARPISLNVLLTAKKFLAEGGNTSGIAEVAPGREGSLSFLWDDSAGNYVYLDIGPRDVIHLYYDVVGSPKWQKVSTVDDPEIILHLRSALRNFAIDQGPLLIPIHQSVSSSVTSPSANANAYSAAA